MTTRSLDGPEEPEPDAPTEPTGDLWRDLRHPDRTQLVYQIREIMIERSYLQHGVEVGAGDLVLDVGANVGVAAVFFAAGCGATVYSFEPVTPIYEILCENIAGHPTCSAHNYGLSSQAGRVPITYYPNADAMSGLYADPAADREFVRTVLVNTGLSEADAEAQLEGRYEPVELTCELRTLSGVLQEYAIDRVDLLKIDVEGAEVDVFEGITRSDWPRIRQVAAEIHDQDGRLARVVALLDGLGFDIATDQEASMRGTDLHLLWAVRP